MNDTILPRALAFARHGLGVFPVNWPVEQAGRLICSCGGDSRGKPCGERAAKHPYGRLVPNGVLSATIESGVIKHWFGYAAPEANLGVCTKELIVIDADPRHGGDETLAALEREHQFPLTWRVLTGGGGEHVIFKRPDSITVKCSNAADNPVLGAGIDIRAQGGYIVAPPSKHISGRVYAWHVDFHPADVPLAEAPAWLIGRLARPAASNGHPPVPPGVWAQLVTEVTEYGDAAAARIAGHLLRRGVDTALARGLMRAWNATCCKPPLDLAELYRVIDRIAVKEAQRLEHADG